jgi:GTPase involved in cell partitioning and DNA repair
MRNLGMPDFHSDGGQSVADVADPVVTAQRSEGLGDGFVQGLGGHVDRVRGLVQIVDNNGAGFKSHDGNLPHSLFVRLLVDMLYLLEQNPLF